MNYDCYVFMKISINHDVFASCSFCTCSDQQYVCMDFLLDFFIFSQPPRMKYTVSYNLIIVQFREAKLLVLKIFKLTKYVQQHTLLFEIFLHFQSNVQDETLNLHHIKVCMKYWRYFSIGIHMYVISKQVQQSMKIQIASNFLCSLLLQYS